MHFEQIVRSHVGCRRSNNEDAYVCRPEIGLWAVADGMGGHAAGDVASALVVRSLDHVADTAGIAELLKTTQEALEHVNCEIYGLSRKNGLTMGSTVVALLVKKDGFACLWAGDSRAYILRGDSLRALTRDHSLVQQLVDSGDLTPEAALNHPNSNIITRAIGHLPNSDIERGSIAEVREGDVFLLASDGLTRLLSEREMAEAGAIPDLERLADHWVDVALERGAPDNLTFILLRVAGD